MGGKVLELRPQSQSPGKPSRRSPGQRGLRGHFHSCLKLPSAPDEAPLLLSHAPHPEQPPQSSPLRSTHMPCSPYWL